MTHTELFFNLGEFHEALAYLLYVYCSLGKGKEERRLLRRIEFETLRQPKSNVSLQSSPLHFSELTEIKISDATLLHLLIYYFSLILCWRQLS